ncbi:abortive infection family protein [Plantibacter sp. CFBP 8775]|nr:abortive infection family protein [Plantibacter sp. CFBP 8775]
MTRFIRIPNRHVSTEPHITPCEVSVTCTCTHCKELLKSQCKIILSAFGRTPNERDGPPALHSETARILGIYAGSVPDSPRASTAVRSMFGCLQTLVRTIAEARSSMGTGHGRESESPAEPRHARMVFNATVSLAEFVASTWATTSVIPGQHKGEHHGSR